MTDKVKLIIEIPKKDYEWAKQIAQTRNESVYCERQIIAISKGTPLPKGHGRLIDERQITEWKQVGLVINDGAVTRCLVTDAPTIIEADKEDDK